MAIEDIIANPYVAPIGQMVSAGRKDKDDTLDRQLSYREKVKAVEHNNFIRGLEQQQATASMIAADVDTIDNEDDFNRALTKYSKIPGMDISPLMGPDGNPLPLEQARPILADIKQQAINTAQQSQEVIRSNQVLRLQSNQRELYAQLRRTTDSKERARIEKQIKQIDDAIDYENTAKSSPFGFTPENVTTQDRNLAGDAVTQWAKDNELDLSLGRVKDSDSTLRWLSNQLVEVPGNVVRYFSKAGKNINPADLKSKMLELAQMHLTDNRLGGINIPGRKDFEFDKKGFEQSVRNYVRNVLRVPSADVDGMFSSGSKQKPTNNEQLPTPKTQEDFDALKSGTLYIDPDDGRTYRKS